MNDRKLIFEKSRKGRKGYSLPDCKSMEAVTEKLIPANLLRNEAPELPELSEVDVIRHFTSLSQCNYGVDAGFYPHRPCSRASAAMRSTERLVQIQMYYIKPHIPRSGYPQDSIGIGTVVV